MANRINARSPFIIEVNETGQTSSKVEVFLWNGTGSAPSTPTYTLSKPIPSATNLQTTYNISPYIREYILHESQTPIYLHNVSYPTPTNEWVNVRVKRYKNTATLLSTTDYIAFDGFVYYSEGYNLSGANVLLDEGTYTYHYDSTVDYSLTANAQLRAGNLTIATGTSWTVKYTNLVSGASYTASFADDRVFNTYRVYYLYLAQGNKVEVFEGATLLKTFYFKPVTECKYTPVRVDFINKQGAWQRQLFYKASFNNLEIENQEFNLMQSDLVNYDVLEGQRKVFNANGKEFIRVNTGFVNDEFSEILQQMLLSERILVDNKPARVKTKTLDKQKELNTKLINYTMEFDFNYNSINNVV